MLCVPVFIKLCVLLTLWYVKQYIYPLHCVFQCKLRVIWIFKRFWLYKYPSIYPALHYIKKCNWATLDRMKNVTKSLIISLISENLFTVVLYCKSAGWHFLSASNYNYYILLLLLKTPLHHCWNKDVGEWIDKSLFFVC